MGGRTNNEEESEGKGDDEEGQRGKKIDERKEEKGRGERKG